jgi:hypothetical protein
MNSDVPEFEMRVGDDGRVQFAHPGQAHAYLKAKFAGQDIVAKFYEYRAQRSDRQNRAFHSLVSPWAKERGWEIEALKQFLLGRIFGWREFLDRQSGEVCKVLAEPHTSKLSVGQFVELIDRTLELAAEDGIWLMAPDEFTKAKATAARRAARKGAAA